MRVHLHFPDVGSLKGKRAELNRIKAHLHDRCGGEDWNPMQSPQHGRFDLPPFHLGDVGNVFVSENGIAVIEVPDDFRIVTDPEGLSIQVTPIGQMATVAVEPSHFFLGACPSIPPRVRSDRPNPPPGCCADSPALGGPGVRGTQTAYDARWVASVK